LRWPVGVLAAIPQAHRTASPAAMQIESEGFHRAMVFSTRAAERFARRR
jgi:hypothetical protein